jgi:hypothetical protein
MLEHNVMMAASQKSEVIGMVMRLKLRKKSTKIQRVKKAYNKAQKTAKGIIDVVAKNEDVLKELSKCQL